MMKTIKEMKNELIKNFKKETGLDKSNHVEICNGSEWLVGKIKDFLIDEDTEKVDVLVELTGERNATKLYLHRTRGAAVCRHKWKFKKRTERQLEIPLIGGDRIKKEICIYECENCKEKEEFV